MAKGDKKAKKGKDKVKVPKRIAGVKVPKSVREAGKSALKLAESPAVSETVAAEPVPAGRRAPGAAADAAGEAGHEAIKLGDSLRKMAIDMARRTLDAWESADSRPASAPHEGKGGKGGNGPDRG